MVVTFENQDRESQRFISFPKVLSLLGPTVSQGCVWESTMLATAIVVKKIKTLIIVSHHRPDIVLGTSIHASLDFHSNSIIE